MSFKDTLPFAVFWAAATAGAILLKASEIYIYIAATVSSIAYTIYLGHRS